MARTRRQRTVYIAGQRWKIQRARLRNIYGDCNYELRRIRVDDRLTGSDHLDTLLHELIHARWPDISEDSVATPNCSCNAKARTMDAKGIEWCEQNIDTIVGWLREEATKRKLPFVDMAGRILVKRAIRNARKAAS